jgi:23S rRNA pseudouridine1911/1915/1917 synthase
MEAELERERELEGVRLVWVDEWLAVVDKPAGLVVHPAPGHRGRTLVDVLGPLLGGGDDPQRPGIVHRLDRDTSGLMLVARNDEAHRALAEAIRERRVHREYLALIRGRPRSRSGTIDAPLGRDHRAPQRRAVGGRGRRAARTHFEVVEVLPEDTLVRVWLETGRTHQIRAHFQAIGHPVAGDPSYGGAGRHGLERQFLHSARLRFVHPRTAQELDLRSPLPADLERALARAREPRG